MNNMMKPGDILIFKAGNDWIGKSIAWITKSDVSHAAMAYQVNKIVEMGGSGISVSTVKVESGETAFLMRHKPDVDAQPLIYAADVYINAKTRYDFPALVILAGLLVYREIRPTPKLTALIDIILRIACKELDKLIQSIVLHNPDKAMVCSQLVYQIYRDCGKTYELNLENGSLQVERNTPSVKGSVSLISLMNSSVNSDISEITLQDIPDEDHQMLGQKLYEAMLEQEEANEIYLGSNDVESLLPWVQKFAELLEEILEKSKSSIPIDALFVTPADLLNHTKNLQLVETLAVKRVQK